MAGDARGSRSIFEEASDTDDSISVTSTVASERGGEYRVETILAQQPHAETGESFYLVKWEGLPLRGSTWEPAKSFKSEQMKEEWEQKQKMIQSGEVEAFDLEAFYQVAEAEANEAQRSARRQAKRKKLGTKAGTSGAASNGSSRAPTPRDEPASSSDEAPLARKRAKFSPPKRKGVAQPVKKSLNREPVPVSSESSEEAEKEAFDSGDSLMEDLQTKAGQKGRRGQQAQPSIKVPSKRLAKTSITEEPVRPGQTRKASVAKDPLTRQATQTPTNGEGPNMAGSSVPKKASADTTTKQSPSGAAPKSAPSTAATSTHVQPNPITKPSGTTRQSAVGTNVAPPKRSMSGETNVFKNWDKPIEKRKRRIADGDTTLDNQGQRLAKNLQHQNRIMKKGALERVAPDPSQLAIFNPKLNKFVQPETAPKATSTALASPPVAPPSAPPPATSLSSAPPALTALMRSASANPLATAPMQPPSAPPAATMVTSKPVSAEPQRPGEPIPVTPVDGNIHRAFGRRGSPPPERPRSASPPREPRDQRGFVPSFFFPHRALQQDKAKLETCRYWARGVCTRDERECWFAHYHIPDEEVARLGVYQAAMEAYERHVQRTGSGPIPPPPPPPGPAMQNARRPQGPNNITCFFWQREGYCRKGEACYFAHWDTGFYAEKPGSRRILSISNGDLVPLGANADTQPQHVNPNLVPVGSGLKNPEVREESEPMLVDQQVEGGSVASPIVQSPAAMEPRRLASVLPSYRAPEPLTQIVTLAIAGTHASSTQATVSAQLACASQQDASALGSSSLRNETLRIQHFIGAADIQNYCADLLLQGSRLPVGDVFANDAGDMALVSFAEACKLQVACGVVVGRDTILLLFPSGVEDWRFLQRPGDAASKTALRFKLLPGLQQDVQVPELSSLPDVQAAKSSATLAGKRLLGLDVERLFTMSDTKPKENNVFVMIPPSRQAELDLLKRFFDGYGCRVWTMQGSGIWERFVKEHGKSCLVLVHTEVPLSKIPKLSGFLNSSEHHGMRIFSINVDQTLPSLDTTVFDCQRLFPAGELTFITDDVFTHHPKQALALIEYFMKINQDRPRSLRSKIATRPGIKDWLMQLVADRTRQSGQTDDSWLNLYTVVTTRLSRPEYDEHFAAGNPGEKSELISLPADELPKFQELLQQDEGQASDYIINWFAGYCLLNAYRFRRFNVVNETQRTGESSLDENFNMVVKPGEADPRGWNKEYQHLRVVRPDQWLKARAKPRR